MTVKCASCGSENTVIMPPSLGFARKGAFLQLAEALSEAVTPSSPKQGPIFGRRAVVCRDCGATHIIFFN
jgi:ribosomal protein S27E